MPSPTERTLTREKKSRSRFNRKDALILYSLFHINMELVEWSSTMHEPEESNIAGIKGSKSFLHCHLSSTVYYFQAEELRFPTVYWQSLRDVDGTHSASGVAAHDDVPPASWTADSWFRLLSFEGQQIAFFGKEDSTVMSNWTDHGIVIMMDLVITLTKVSRNTSRLSKRIPLSCTDQKC
jgi:hypothetical protein